MKTRFLALAALVLGLASCQTEPEGLDVNVGGEVDSYITVSLPETTRANSHLGAFDNVVEDADYTIRYIFQVFYGETESKATRQVIYTDSDHVSFPVRLVPNRHYNFVVWADVVPADGKVMNTIVDYDQAADYHYNTADLKDITIIDENGHEWKEMDETRDAFTGQYDTAVDGDGTPYTGAKNISFTLTRPFAKLRIITTDMEQLNDLVIAPTTAEVEYTTDLFASFNAFAGAVNESDKLNKTHETFAIKTYEDNEYDKSMVLFTDYLFAADQDEEVNFTLSVYDQYEAIIGKTINFNTPIPARRNYLTTISGNILTDGNKIEVTVTDEFANAGTSTDAPYYQQTISSAAEFYKALENGGEYIVISDFLINYAYVPAPQRTAALGNTTPTTTLINLNGMTITVDNDTNEAFVDINRGALIIAGEGAIDHIGDGNGKLVDNGDVVVTDNAVVDEKVADVKTGIEALKHICENGGEFTFTEDLESSDVVFVKTANPVVINGNNFTLTSSANRAIRATVANANITVNNLNVKVTTERVGTSDIRGFSIDDVTNASLTLNNCSVDFTPDSAFDWSYAVNVVGGSKHKVTINGGTYEGANVINVWGDNQTINIDGATLTSIYRYNESYRGQCIRLEGTGCHVTVKNSIFNGEHASVLGEKTPGANTIVFENNTDNTMYFDDNTYFVASAEKLQKAVNVTDKDEINIKLINDIVGDAVLVIQKQGVKINIDGDNHKFNGYIKVHSNSYHYADAALNIKNVNFETAQASVNFIEALENGAERYSTNITAENCTFTATGEAVDTAVGLQIKSSKNAKVLNCTATDMHSLIQAQSCDETVVVKDCTINGKNGVAFKQVKAATVEGTTIVAREYGIRFDGNIDNYGIVVKNNNITAAQPFIIRKMTGKNNTIALEGTNTLNTTAEGDYQIVVTNGADDAAYVIPTGTYTLTGADNFFVFPSVATVNSAEELVAALAKNTTFITLASDIDLANVAWTPAGTSAKPWYGIFDGNNKKISNLTINGTDYAALIAYSGANSTIKNLSLENVDINSTKHAAGVVCVAEEGLTLNNVKVSGNIVAASYAGGIMHNGANATIKNCENSANVSAQRAGGIASWVTVGAVIDSVVNRGTITGTVGASGIAHGFAGSIKNATNYGDVSSANYEAAAGIAGVQKAASTYEYCYNYGNVTSTYDDANASAAGILGQTAGSASTLKYCANYGEIKAEKSYAAGIAYSLYGTINASYCYNNGAVYGADGAGAIAPKAQYGTGDKASYCLNAGAITSEGNVYQGSNNNVSSFYYKNGELLNVSNNTVTTANDALAALNGGTDANFFKLDNGVIVVK